ncbi:hypothetical protein T265_04811 [Opisthorchis viverrini]|uniref:Uncharacterized protein n=1 Tax=Opisthorchis viverrini TaxID=6198 RepID=A0A075AG37_OPIVI|nr:hypothetical protein T265_04811 [Opisthorchis viverrini]KER28354.1 hypothetical protein T265_04811 [Opisthorchis viverrini]
MKELGQPHVPTMANVHSSAGILCEKKREKKKSPAVKWSKLQLKHEVSRYTVLLSKPPQSVETTVEYKMSKGDVASPSVEHLMFL